MIEQDIRRPERCVFEESRDAGDDARRTRGMVRPVGENRDVPAGPAGQRAKAVERRRRYGVMALQDGCHDRDPATPLAHGPLALIAPPPPWDAGGRPTP